MPSDSEPDRKDMYVERDEQELFQIQKGNLERDGDRLMWLLRMGELIDTIIIKGGIDEEDFDPQTI
ncbi:hypothetical protein BY996DRAFT_6436684 [Phakopsora pachyrhizi]|nr:hypothetical protein BY996DRAFT_6436684 [Phakopsora pachyrhizi]